MTNIKTKNNIESGSEKIKQFPGFEGVVNGKKKSSKHNYYHKSYPNSLHRIVGKDRISSFGRDPEQEP